MRHTPTLSDVRVLASTPNPALLTLPWGRPLETWTEYVVPVPRGLSRHVVRIVHLDLDRIDTVVAPEEQLRLIERHVDEGLVELAHAGPTQER